MAEQRQGGCLCGAVRYEVAGEPVVVALCHCSMCRRSTAAPAVAWAMFEQGALRFVAGNPTAYASSPGVERAFCGRCGTPLTFRADFLPGLVDVTVGSMDAPATLPPQMHIWAAKQLPWLVLADTLPRHDGLPPQA
jgi:hypothetical protein